MDLRMKFPLLLIIGLSICQSSGISSNFCDISSYGLIDGSMTTVSVKNVIEHYIFRDKYRWKLNIKCSESDDCEEGIRDNDKEILESIDSGDIFTKSLPSKNEKLIHTIPANLSFVASGFNTEFNWYGNETIKSYEFYRKDNVCVIILKEEINEKLPPLTFAETSHTFKQINASLAINPLQKGFFITLNQNMNNVTEYSRDLQIYHFKDYSFDKSLFNLLRNVIEKNIDKRLYINGFLTIALSNNDIKMIVFVTHNGIGKHCYVSIFRNCEINDLIENGKTFGCKSYETMRIFHSLMLMLNLDLNLRFNTVVDVWFWYGMCAIFSFIFMTVSYIKENVKHNHTLNELWNANDIIALKNITIDRYRVAYEILEESNRQLTQNAIAHAHGNPNANANANPNANANSNAQHHNDNPLNAA